MPSRRRPPAGTGTDLPPLKILRKILLLQLAYYAAATVLVLFTSLVYGTPFSLGLILDWDALRGDTTIGWILGLVWLLNGLISVIFLLLLVSRSKLIPDFALTIHFLHLIASSLYSHSIPTNILWWGLQCASAALMIFLGIWACQWRELKPISFGGKRPAEQSTASSQSTQGVEEQQLEGSSRGHGRGRNLSESDGYEMVRMKKSDDESA